MLTMPFSRQYSVADAQALAAFGGPDGLALIRHYPLNEHCFGDAKNMPLGYFFCDFEEAGPYCVLAEARALADGNPTYIGYLSANSFQRGFAEYVRAFNRAFLALPAIPGVTLSGASSNKDVVVREYRSTEHGTWYAVINTAFTDAVDVEITLPQKKMSDVLTGVAVSLKQGRALVSLYPGQVMVWHADIK